MRFKRRRSIRPESARCGPGSGLETLEERQLLSQSGLGHFFQYAPSDLSVYNPITHRPSPYSVKHQLLSNPGPENPLLGNEGKIVSGKDRQGNEWTITVHGPGIVIVTDTSPNDGILDDSIDTIQLVGTDINKTYVTGNVVGSFRVQTNSTTDFNRLIDSEGVRSVILNGFNLSQTVIPAAGSPNNVTTGIYLTGGVRELTFTDVNAPIDTATTDVAINVVIGDPSTPLRYQPRIKINSINNTVFDSTATAVPANVPQTTPSVNIIVNGQIKSLSLVSAGAATAPASDQFRFPTVASTGRTSVQAIGIDTLDVRGAATNFTASRGSRPFVNGFSGLARLRSAHFHGPTDAVGLDVNGPINSATFDKGIGNTNGLFLTSNANGSGLPATGFGQSPNTTGFAGAGFVGGQVTATRIGRLRVAPGNVALQTPTNPDFVQLTRQGTTFYVVRPGTALANAVIVSSGNIGRTDITGDSVNSEIKTGFHYPSFAAGLEGTRAPSRLGPLHQNGSLIGSVNSATYRPFMHFYGTTADVKGPGRITGRQNGFIINTGGLTPLGNVGAGNYARTKRGQLPPPAIPTRVHGVLVR